MSNVTGWCSIKKKVLFPIHCNRFPACISLQEIFKVLNVLQVCTVSPAKSSEERNPLSSRIMLNIEKQPKYHIMNHAFSVTIVLILIVKVLRGFEGPTDCVVNFRFPITWLSGHNVSEWAIEWVRGERVTYRDATHRKIIDESKWLPCSCYPCARSTAALNKEEQMDP